MQLSIQSGRPPLPKEHGGWAMLITPPVVALVAAGPDQLGMAALAGWFCAYCLRGPVEALRGAAATGRAGMTHADPAVARLWLTLFGVPAVLLLGAVVWLRPWSMALLGFAALLLAVVQHLADRGEARSLAAGLLAVAGLMAGGPLYYLAAKGEVTPAGWALTLASAAFFAGSVFRVKTLARERRSPAFRLLSVGFHLALLAAAAALVPLAGAPALFPLALVPAVGWAVYGAVRAGAAVSLATIGKGEQWLTILFGLVLMVTLRI
jgi:hypothetical protein